MPELDVRINLPVAERLPPRPAATVVLLRGASRGPELLMLRRTKGASHFGGSYVFPGGMVDPEDEAPAMLRRVVGLGKDEANRRLGVDSGGLRHWVAVVRECYEEAGILLAVDEALQPLAPARVAGFESARTALNKGTLSFREFLERERLLLPAHAVNYFSHWITPPVQKRRFDTRFFLAHAPAGQQGLHDDGEMVDAVWLPAEEALARAGRKEMNMAFPTRQVLLSVKKFATPEEAVSHVRSLTVIISNRPCFAEGRDGRKMFRPGEAPYAEIHWTDPDELGTTSYDISPGVAKKLDRFVTRITAPNPGVMTGPGTNTYLVGEKELAVIDPGPAEPAHVAAILAAGGKRIRWILCTHTHRDHSPAAALLKHATGAQILGRPAPQAPNHDQSLAVDRPLAHGEALEFDGISLRAVFTPGHASNHLCYLLDRTRMLFTGDHVMQGSTVVIWPPDGNMAAYLGSLKHLLELDLAILAPGHGYLIGHPHAEVDRLLHHRLAREQKVRNALAGAGGRATLEALLPFVYDDVPASIHPVAARSLQAHLEKLIDDGEVSLQQDTYCSR